MCYISERYERKYFVTAQPIPLLYQDPNRDTEWNDVLRAKGIIPAKQEAEISEDQIIKLVDATIEEKANTGKPLEDLNLDELDELEDDEDERVLFMYRQQRLEELRKLTEKSKFGDVREISAEDYVTHVNKAGDGIWVILHLYKPGIPLCALINQYLEQLSIKFPMTKVLKSVSSTCIPNYPDKNLPSIFIYYEGELKKQIIGPHEFGGMNLTIDVLEWKLSEAGAWQSTIKSDPRPKIHDVMDSSIRAATIRDESDSD